MTIERMRRLSSATAIGIRTDGIPRGEASHPSCWRPAAIARDPFRPYDIYAPCWFCSEPAHTLCLKSEYLKTR